MVDLVDFPRRPPPLFFFSVFFPSSTDLARILTDQARCRNPRRESLVFTVSFFFFFFLFFSGRFLPLPSYWSEPTGSRRNRRTKREGREWCYFPPFFFFLPFASLPLPFLPGSWDLKDAVSMTKAMRTCSPLPLLVSLFLFFFFFL